MKKLKMDPCFALRVTKILFYAGFAVLFLDMIAIALTDAFGVLIALTVCGGVMMAAGVVVGFTYVKCPYCGGSLMAGGRIPNSLSHYCPHCGHKL